MNRLAAAFAIVSCLAVPAIADVVFSVSDAGNAQLKISYTTTGGDLPQCIALRVSLSDGATVAIPHVASHLAFNTFIDWAYSNAAGYGIGMGHPLAMADGPGALTASASVFSICMCVLDPSGNQGAGPASADPLIILQLEKGTADYTDITVAADTLRGPDSGVVGPAGPITSNLSLGPIRLIPGHPCVHATNPSYGQWVAVGKPESWCNPRQCHGDANNAKDKVGKLSYYVGFGDVHVLLAGFAKTYSDPSRDTWIAADFDRTPDRVGKLYYRVGFDDVNILLAYFAKPDAQVPPDCNNPQPAGR